MRCLPIICDLSMLLSLAKGRIGDMVDESSGTIYMALFVPSSISPTYILLRFFICDDFMRRSP